MTYASTNGIALDLEPTATAYPPQIDGTVAIHGTVAVGSGLTAIRSLDALMIHASRTGLSITGSQTQQIDGTVAVGSGLTTILSQYAIGVTADRV
jgi:hypothetical protein